MKDDLEKAIARPISGEITNGQAIGILFVLGLIGIGFVTVVKKAFKK